MKNPERWRQRLQNFTNAVASLQARCAEAEITPAGFPYHEAVQMALVQAFEIVLELGWKTLKDYLENDGYADIKTGREAIRQSHQIDLIDNGENWLTALDLRNLTSHTYDEQILMQINNFVTETFIHDANALLEKLKAKN